MDNPNEKKFYDILNNIFIGHDIDGKGGIVNLIKAKNDYYTIVKQTLLDEVNKNFQTPSFKEELYDKLYSFFNKYFNETGSIYFNHSPSFYNIHTKEYQDTKTSYISDYETLPQKKDVSLFYKTRCSYYIKQDNIFRNIDIEIENTKFKFDTSNLLSKIGNEKTTIKYSFKGVEKDDGNHALQINVNNSSQHLDSTMKYGANNISKDAKAAGLIIDEEIIKKAIRIFEKQSKCDFFINKNANAFLNEQFNLWIYQYLFSQELEFDLKRFNQIQDIKKIAKMIIVFISQFENELVKIWNKPRFVLDSNIVVTLNLLKDKGFNISKITEHKNYKEQQNEWEELKVNNQDFLPIDTKYFKDLKEEIEALFSKDEINGILIKSENYQALNSILKSFKNKINLIYIDPPYNTGNDGFMYIDSFSNSSYLTMMQNRLELARELLSEDGCIFVSIDDNEQAYLKVLMDDIFGRENFVGDFIRKTKSTTNDAKTGVNIQHENCLCYAKQRDKVCLLGGEKDLSKYKNPDNDPNGAWVSADPSAKRITENSIFPIINPYTGKEDYPPIGMSWRFSKNTIQSHIDYGRICFKKEHKENERGFIYKRYLKDLQTTKRVFDTLHFANNDFMNQVATKEAIGIGFVESFEYPKPQSFIKKILETTDEGDLVLDFFAGSGTTCAVAQKMGRKYIGIEMDKHFDSVIIPRLKKVIGGHSSQVKDGGGEFRGYF